jgi:hypothetical protein
VRINWPRLGILLFGVAGFLGLFLYFWKSLGREEETPPPYRIIVPERPEDWREPPEARSRAVEATVRAPRRPLQAEARVFDAEHRLLSGVRMRLGDEEVDADPEGVVRFAPAVRPRFASLGVSAGGVEAARFERVVVGDAEAASEEESGALVYASQLPERPLRLEWTVNLLRTDPLHASGAASGRTAQEQGDGPAIDVESVLVENWGVGGRVSARGRASLPPGAHIYLTLELDGFRVAGTLDPAQVQDGSWAGILPLTEAVRLQPGTYEIVGSFHVLLEPLDLVESWRNSLGEARTAQLHEVVERRLVFFGDPEAAVRADMLAKEYYRRVFTETRRQLAVLKHLVDVFGLLGKGWDPELIARYWRAHEAWFQERGGLAREFLDDEGRLREDRWRSFLDSEWRPQLDRLLAEHRARGGGRHPEAETRTESLLGAVRQMSLIYSRFVVYPLFQLPPHPNDFFLDERGREDLELLENIVGDHSAYLARFTGERLSEAEAVPRTLPGGQRSTE